MANNSAQDPTQWVRVDVAYGESYTSAALNKKLAGILQTGVYWGFEVVPATGMNVKIYPGENPDYPKNVVVAGATDTRSPARRRENFSCR